MKRRTFLAQASVSGASVAFSSLAHAAYVPSVVITWNQALLASIAATRTQAPVAARAISMVHEAVYNAWAAYDAVAAFTLSGLTRQPLAARTTTAKSIAVCWAASAVLADLFPTRQSVFSALLASTTPSTGLSTADAAAAAVGRNAANALLAMRHVDGANQLGDLAPGAYSDTSGYVPVNGPDTVVDPTRWQPLRVVDTGTGLTVVQQFLTPHWNRVKPFALWSASAYRPSFSPAAPTMTELLQVVNFSAALDNTTKAQVELWAANPGSVSPPGQWMQIAEQVSANDGNTLDKDVKLFFGAGQALLDASIAAWDAKRAYDSVRPITGVRYYLRGQTIRAWGGPGLGTVTMLGEQWRPYQRPTNPSPPFPEFISGHSTFSRAAAEVLTALTGTPFVPGGLGTFVAEKDNFLVFERGPSETTVIQWATWYDAADLAGQSRRWGGIHPAEDDYPARVIGSNSGKNAWALALKYFSGELLTESIDAGQTWNFDGTITLRTPTRRGLFYQWEYTTDLQTWLPLTPTSQATDTTLSFVDTPPAGQRRFYRARWVAETP